MFFIWLFMAFMGSRTAMARGFYPLNTSAGSSPGMFAVHVATSLMFFAAFVLGGGEFVSLRERGLMP